MAFSSYGDGYVISAPELTAPEPQTPEGSVHVAWNSVDNAKDYDIRIGRLDQAFDSCLIVQEGVSGLASDVSLPAGIITKWSNSFKLPIFMTATCIHT